IRCEQAWMDHELRQLSQRHQQAAQERLPIEQCITPNLIEDALQAHATTTGLTGQVSALQAVDGGFSKDTYLFELEREDGSREQLVLRRDLPFGPNEVSVIHEAEPLQRLHEAGLPVPLPRLVVAEEHYFGMPAIVVERLAGRSGTAEFHGDEDSRRAICLQLAAMLGRLHSLPPSTLGLTMDARATPSAVVASHIRDWRDRWYRHRVHASPTLTLAYAWLLENIPPNDGPARSVHGDVGFHNTLVYDGRITALLDWEFLHAGDAVEDLSYCRQFVEPLMPWDEFLTAYRSSGGAPYRDASARFYELWRHVRNATACAISWRGFIGRNYPAMKMAYQGIPLYRAFLGQVATELSERLALP
ncbi:MAG: phosphotransferase family protein, partial [Gammaproteobacteria bacterium]|nr:phosphotransferase family protein [Gammaproteobacteria bacterium]